MADAKQITRQERALADAQRQLERIERQYEQMKKAVEREMQALNELKEVSTDFTRDNVMMPSINASSPETFRSQFDKYAQTLSSQRLTSNLEKANKSVDNLFQQSGTIPMQKTEEPVYIPSDRAEHYEEVVTPPVEPLYVSGYYYSSGEETKRYEYLAWPGLYPLKVGDMVQAPVHVVGYHQGKTRTPGHDRRFIVTDIYSKERFLPYHDVIMRK